MWKKLVGAALIGVGLALLGFSAIQFFHRPAEVELWPQTARPGEAIEAFYGKADTIVGATLLSEMESQIMLALQAIDRECAYALSEYRYSNVIGDYIAIRATTLELSVNNALNQLMEQLASTEVFSLLDREEAYFETVYSSFTTDEDPRRSLTKIAEIMAVRQHEFDAYETYSWSITLASFWISLASLFFGLIAVIVTGKAATHTQ